MTRMASGRVRNQRALSSDRFDHSTMSPDASELGIEAAASARRAGPRRLDRGLSTPPSAGMDTSPRRKRTQIVRDDETSSARCDRDRSAPSAAPAIRGGLANSSESQSRYRADRSGPERRAPRRLWLTCLMLQRSRRRSSACSSAASFLGGASTADHWKRFHDPA